MNLCASLNNDDKHCAPASSNSKVIITLSKHESQKDSGLPVFTYSLSCPFGSGNALKEICREEAGLHNPACGVKWGWKADALKEERVELLDI